MKVSFIFRYLISPDPSLMFGSFNGSDLSGIWIHYGDSLAVEVEKSKFIPSKAGISLCSIRSICPLTLIGCFAWETQVAGVRSACDLLSFALRK